MPSGLVDATGAPQMPPHNQLATNVGSANAGIVDEIENPNPQLGTNNDYVQDGYRGLVRFAVLWR
jgi:phospholipase C